MSKRLPIVVVDTCVFLAAMTSTEPHHHDATALLRRHRTDFTIAFPVLQELEFLALRKYEKQDSDTPESIILNKNTWTSKALDWIESQSYIPLELNHSMIRFASMQWSDTYIKRNDAALLAAAEAIRAKTLYTLDKRLIRQAQDRNRSFEITLPPQSQELPLGI